jgi:hypothetical protein
VFVGAISTLLIFNQINIGTNLSLLWLFVAAFPLLRHYRLPLHRSTLLLIFFGVFAVKFALFGNSSAVIRYVSYTVFVGALLLSFKRRDYDLFFRGFEIGLAINTGFGIFQMMGEVSGAYHAVFNPQAWNPHLWHANPPGGMFSAWPRVSGFANEPAYLGLLYVVNGAYRIFIAGKTTLTGIYGLYLFGALVFLVNSRTSFYSYVFLAFAASILYIRDERLAKPIAIVIYVLSFIIMPLYIIHGTSDARTLQELLTDDVSIFARAVPLHWAMNSDYISLSGYMIGVGDYTKFVSELPLPDDIYDAFVNQGMFADSKSLGGAYFYDLGFVGLATFAALLAYIYGWRTRALLFFSIVNIGCFNIYAFSWPLFWILVIAGTVTPALAAERREARRVTRKVTATASALRGTPSRGGVPSAARVNS